MNYCAFSIDGKPILVNLARVEYIRERGDNAKGSTLIFSNTFWDDPPVCVDQTLGEIMLFMTAAKLMADAPNW